VQIVAGPIFHALTMSATPDILNKMLALMPPAMHLVAEGELAFNGDLHTTADLAKRIGRTRNPVEVQLGRLVTAGFFIKQSRRGRKGGGKLPTRLLLADLDNSIIVSEIASRLGEANQFSLFAQKANALPFLAQKSNALLPPVQSLPAGPVQSLLSDSVVDRTADFEAPRPNFQKYSSDREKTPIVAHNHLPYQSYHFPCGVDGGGISPTSNTFPAPLNATENSSHLEQIAEYYDSPSSTRLISIDPSLNRTGIVTLDIADIGPAIIDARVLNGCELTKIDLNNRVALMARNVDQYLTRFQPDIIVIEQPDHSNPGYKHIDRLHAAATAILNVIRASGIPHDAIPAEDATGKANLKIPNMELFHSINDTLTSEHVADAFALGWRYAEEHFRPPASDE
jgi:Holliday junction resolvasome RuvABC endonuclease subunit